MIGYHIAMVLRDFWCGIIVLIVHTATENNSEEPTDSYYEELQQLFDYFAKFGVKILLQKLNVKLGREDDFKTANESESLNANSISSEICHIKKSDSLDKNVPSLKLLFGTLGPLAQGNRTTWTGYTLLIKALLVSLVNKYD